MPIPLKKLIGPKSLTAMIILIPVLLVAIIRGGFWGDSDGVWLSVRVWPLFNAPKPQPQGIHQSGRVFVGNDNTYLPGLEPSQTQQTDTAPASPPGNGT